MCALAAAWISRPVGELTSAAQRIAKGDLATPVKVRERFAAKELGGLAQVKLRFRCVHETIIPWPLH